MALHCILSFHLCWGRIKNTKRRPTIPGTCYFWKTRPLPANTDNLVRAGFHKKSDISSFSPSTNQSTRPKMMPPTRSIQWDHPNPFFIQKYLISLNKCHKYVVCILFAYYLPISALQSSSSCHMYLPHG